MAFSDQRRTEIQPSTALVILTIKMIYLVEWNVHLLNITTDWKCWHWIWMESGVWQRYIHHWDHCTEYSKPKYNSHQWLAVNFNIFSFHSSISKQAFRSFWKLQSSLHKATYLHLPVSYYEARKLINPYVVKRKGFHVCVNYMTIISGQWKVSVCKFTNMSQTNGK